MKTRATKGKVLFVLLCIMGMLSACASQEILQEAPVTFQLDGEELLEKTIDDFLSEKDSEGLGEDNVDELQDESFLMSEIYPYAFQSLDEKEQAWYKDIEQCLGKMSEGVTLDKTALREGLTEEDINLIFQCVLMDHPELFYVEGYTYTLYTRGNATVSIEFAGTYNVDVDTAKEKKRQIESAAEEILLQVANLENDYDKMKAIYETIIFNTDYEVGAADNQNIYSVFVNGRSVCQGYAKATQYLCNMAGIECTLVMGTVDDGMGHAWNLVNLDDNFYYVDTTWGDVSYDMTEGQSQDVYTPEINYDYLCITTRKLSVTHTIDTQIPVPECISLDNNYYVRENAYFTEYNREQMATVFQRMYEQGKRDVTIMCSDVNCYEMVERQLLDEQEIFNYLAGHESVGFSLSPDQLSMTFWMTNE